MTPIDANARKPPSVEILGVPLDSFTLNGLIAYLISESIQNRGGYVVTPNLQHMQAITSDPLLRVRALSAEVRVADGMPLIWASRIQRTPLPERVAGSDLVGALAPALERANRSLFLLGGTPGTADRAARVLLERNPRLRLAGTYCPPLGFESDPAVMQELRAVLQSAAPDFVYVGLPFLKASSLATDLCVEFPGTWFLGIGVSLSFLSGEVARAPRWLQIIGLEWVHRLIQEPRRLIRRYLLEGLPFGVRLLLHVSARRYRSAPDTKSHSG